MVKAISYGEVFRKAVGMEDAEKLRKFKTVDIVRRLGVLSPDRTYLNNYPIRNPTAVFNPAIVVNGEYALVYARIVIGYYMYVSAIVRIDVPVEDIYSGNLNLNYYASQPVIYPSTRYDLWGAEDPRVYEVDGVTAMTYTGRTINYFNPAIRRERTLAITAIKVRNERWGNSWRKLHAYVFPRYLREHVVSDKDAFLAKAGSRFYLFHRPHMDDEVFYLAVSSTEVKDLAGEGLREVRIHDTTWVLRHSSFESKLGWATPPIKIKDREFITFVHAMDSEIQAYRLFSMHIEVSEKEGVIIRAVTPNYIMEPKLSYEVFGDRPYTIFPCGLWLVEKDKALISYGAADFMVGIGEIDVNELLSQLDKGRIM